MVKCAARNTSKSNKNEMALITGRALHYVFKIPDRKTTMHFYRNILGMNILRHEEFADGCEAACNGPYSNRWSKTMVGYGPEDTHFVIELTYNYGVNSYSRGNDFLGISIQNRDILQRAKAWNWPVLEGNILQAPGGYPFHIIDNVAPVNRDPVQKVTLACSDLEKTTHYWSDILGLQVFEKTATSICVGFKDTEAKLELQLSDSPIDRQQAYGRIAFACPSAQQPQIQAVMETENQTILKPLISLDTPGKATVRVIILADPDGHEICFVDEEGFQQLSKVDSESEKLLDKHIEKDKSMANA